MLLVKLQAYKQRSTSRNPERNTAWQVAGFNLDDLDEVNQRGCWMARARLLGRQVFVHINSMCMSVGSVSGGSLKKAIFGHISVIS